MDLEVETVTMSPLFLLTLLVFLGGYIGSLMSGGSLLVFSGLTFLDMPVKVRIGTLKFLITVLALFSAITYLKGKAVNVRLAPSLVFPSIIGSFLGAKIILFLPDNVVNIVVAFLLFTGVVFTLKLESKMAPGIMGIEAKGGILPILAGMLVGVYIGMLGIASTILTISILVALFRFKLLIANGTAKMIIFANNLVACAIYGFYDSVDFFIGSLMSIPIAIGAWAGAKTALKIRSSTLKIIFIAMAAITIIKLLSEIIW